MEFMQLVNERYSVRGFKSEKVEKEKLDKILEAGRLAPTAKNFQPQRILVLDSEDNLEKIKLCTNSHFNAPLVIVVCYDKEKSARTSYDNKDQGEIDASIVATHMMMEATDIGIGSTWVAAFSKEELIKQFNIPKTYEPVCLLVMGYPSENAKPNSLHYERKDLSETVFYNTF